MEVILIAAMFGLPVIITAAVSDSRGALNLAAIASGLIGILTGNPMFMAADLFAVAVAYTWGVNIQSNRTRDAR